MYTCPMHPEIVRDEPGTCPICHMDLVPQGPAPKAPRATEDKGLGQLTWRSYMPLVAIFTVLLLATAALSVNDAGLGNFEFEKSISYFMIGFFLTFATFKLMDLPGFAHGYQTYDLLAMRAPWYGYAYPFLELFFGLAMILAPFSRGLLIAEFAVMSFSGLGVAIKIAKKEEFMCACLGTFLKVPLTKVTLIEDFGMAALAGAMFFLL